MAELADVQDLGSCVARRAGSSPVIRTKKRPDMGLFLFLILFFLEKFHQCYHKKKDTEESAQKTFLNAGGYE